MALVFALWVMVILCAVALELKFSSHLRLQVTANMGGTSKAFFLARAGVERAIADAVEGRDRVQSQADLRESDTRIYHNVELGEGSYTLYAGTDSEGEPVYGIIDEAAKINVNKADAATLAKVPGVDADLAAAIEDLRKHEECRDLNDLLLIEGVDLLTLYGEDQNANGILDPNENDGDLSWPPDNADDQLDGGLAVYLTTWSAARDVTADGEDRVDINSASAEEMAKSLPGIDLQQAESIVAHREKNKFTSIVELLDVELVEKVAEEPKGKEAPPEKAGEGPKGQPPDQGKSPDKSSGNDGEKGKAEEKSDEASKDGDGPPSGPPDESEAAEPGDKQPQITTKGTGQKAFDMSQFRRIADLVTVEEEDVIQGIVNINTAPYDVLACLPGMEEALARGIVHEREARPEGFTTVVDLLDVEGISVEVFKEVSPHVSTRSDVFSVRSFGVLGDGDIYCCASAVIDRTDDTVRLRYWRELE